MVVMRLVMVGLMNRLETINGRISPWAASSRRVYVQLAQDEVRCFPYKCFVDIDVLLVARHVALRMLERQLFLGM